MLSARRFLGIEPLAKIGSAESPKFADVRAVNLAAARHFLERLRMNSQKSRGLGAVKQWLEFRNR